MLVLAGATEPYGDKPGGARVPQVQFWQQLLCVHPKKTKKGKKLVRTNGCTAPTFDVLSHHPIDNTGSGPLRSGPMAGDASTPDLGRIVQVLRGAEKAKTVSGHHPVWVTEFWWDSKPPNPVGAPLQTQARWIEQSLYLFWKAGASTAINFQIADSTTRPDAHAGYQAGVYFNDGRPKPSLTAFRFPFVTERAAKKDTLRAWGKSPEAGKLKIQRRQGSRWVTVRSLSVSKGGTFQATLKLSGKQQLRATVGGSQSLIWKQAAFGKGGSDGGGPGTALIVLILAAGAALVFFGGSRLRRRQIAKQRRPRPVTRLSRG
jgi:hypothetical protein